MAETLISCEALRPSRMPRFERCGNLTDAGASDFGVEDIEVPEGVSVRAAGGGAALFWMSWLTSLGSGGMGGGAGADRRLRPAPGWGSGQEPDAGGWFG